MMKKTIGWGAFLTAIGMVVAVIVFIVRLQADLEYLVKDHSAQEKRLAAQEDRLAAIETKIKELSERDPATPITHSPEEACESAKIVALPTRTVPVHPTTRISWTPAHCKMVVQGYQDEMLVNEFQKIPKESGAVTVGQAITRPDGTMNLGMTELKIWVPGSPTPAHEGVWVNVRR